ncbi:uncharacterized protein LOC129299622 [Prosopis cineraria]|uniref:uncharacterized protein LOC129299622 n=1 Tax=Prosopis cineraria TaxID=364024 RepID=UPI00240F9E86|nr:uncharacterized protein LOC129299622 [Prosopis cineraria]
MTNSSKNKFFLCFRPVVDLDVMLDSPVPSHPSPACRFSSDSAPHKDEIHNPHSSLPPKRKLSRLIKAMVFETILSRRSHRKNRSRRDSFESEGSYSTTCTEETSSTGDDRSILSQASLEISSIQDINPDSWFSSDSKFLRKSESCPSEAKPRKRSRRDPLEKKRTKLNCSGIFTLLLSLMLTVFWGKILGIMLTSVWLYSYSVLRARYLRQKTERKLKKGRTGITRDGDNKGH